MKDTHTPLLSFRVPPELRAKFTAAVRRDGTDRTAVLTAFMRWYCGEPGAVLPVPKGDRF